MKKLKATLFLSLLYLLCGCFPGNEFATRHLIGPYYLDEPESGSGAWYLHFEDSEFGLGDALLNCQIVKAGFNKKGIILRAVCSNPQFYFLPIGYQEDRETARQSIKGPFTKFGLEAEIHRVCGDDVPEFDEKLTASR